MTRVLRLPSLNARGAATPSRDTRFWCVVTGCRRRVGRLPSGYEHVCCAYHGALLPRALREAIVLVGDHSVFNAGAVRDAALVVLKIKKCFGQAPRKAKRKHA